MYNVVNFPPLMSVLISGNKLTSICAFFLDKCSMIKKVGEPIVHHHSGLTQGAWMRDPLGILGAQKIWYMNGYNGYSKVLEFDSMDRFKAGMVSKTYTLPYSYRGTGAVVYGRYLYYNRFIN